jgi:FkbM family methyltransferase
MNLKTAILDLIRSVFKIRFFELVLVKCTQGKSVGSICQKITPNNYTYRGDSIREVKRGGINYQLNLYDMVDWYIYYGFSNPCGSDMFSYMNLNDTIIDVGANNGEASLRASKIVGQQGKIISFEPLLTNIKRFKKNLSLNPQLNNISLVKKGVGNNQEDVVLVNDRKDNLGMGWVQAANDDGHYKYSYSQKISIVTLDAYLLPIELDRVDFIKIDVEGFELNVLLGAVNVIKKYKPILFIEVVDLHLKKQNTSAIELIKYLEDLNYIIMNSGNGEIVTQDTNFDKMMDVLCISR